MWLCQTTIIRQYCLPVLVCPHVVSVMYDIFFQITHITDLSYVALHTPSD